MYRYSHGGEDEPRVLLLGEGVSRVVAGADDAVDGRDDLLVEETAAAAAARGPDREDEGERRGSDARVHGIVARQLWLRVCECSRISFFPMS